MPEEPSQIFPPFPFYFIGNEVFAKPFFVMVMGDDMGSKRNLKEGLNGVLNMGLIEGCVY
jgi:hypothetical protein